MVFNKRELVINLFNSGVKSPKILQSRSKLSRSQVFHILKLLKQGVPVEINPRRGRKKIYGQTDRRRIAHLARKHDTWSAKKISNEAESRGSPKISAKTCQRELRDMGYRKQMPLNKPMLTKKHKRTRVEWCQKHLKTDWTKVIFSDESMFQLFRHGSKVWGKKRVKRPKPKFPPKFMVWGAFGYRGKSCLKVVAGKMDSSAYVNILEECLVNDMSILYPDGWTFQQDNATVHTSRFTKSWFESKKIYLIKWPPCSPDLNPIEMIWGIMKKRLDHIMSSNLNDWKLKVMETWENLGHETLTKLIDSMTWRLKECIRLNGDTVDYISFDRRNK